MGQQGDLLGMLLPLVVFVVIFYFLLIRPQKKKQKQHETMLASIHRGDDVVTAGGFFGLGAGKREVQKRSGRCPLQYQNCVLCCPGGENDRREKERGIAGLPEDI